MKSQISSHLTWSVVRQSVALSTGILLLAFSAPVLAQFEDYRGSEVCKQCHEEQYNEWKTSGHPYKLQEWEKAQHRPIPLPEGVDSDDVSWVIGGYKWKSRYIDDQGYIITNDGSSEGGNTQYNYLTGEWSDYHADEPNGTKPYDCGQCHTTGWIADEDADTDGDLSDNQGNLPGMHGIFAFGGIQCEQCHTTTHPGVIDTSAEACGECHIRGEPDTIPASGGFVRHHEQYNELLASPHAALDCVSCHNPHKRGEFGIKDSAECGVSCHSGVMASYQQTSMYDYGVSCQDCHMPMATKSAQALGPHQGDVKTHIFRINTDPDADMFTPAGDFVQLDDDGEASITMDFACQSCHETASLEELGKYAEDFHSRNGSLEGIGMDPGISGTWSNFDRSGEGFLIELGFAGGAKFLFASFYTYDDQGNQVFLLLNGVESEMDGTSVTSPVYITSGYKWGDAFDPSDGELMVWGTGTMNFETCTSGSFVFTPNDDAIAAGFTELGYDISRVLEPGMVCPTFVNNAE